MLYPLPLALVILSLTLTSMNMLKLMSLLVLLMDLQDLKRRWRRCPLLKAFPVLSTKPSIDTYGDHVVDIYLEPIEEANRRMNSTVVDIDGSVNHSLRVQSHVRDYLSLMVEDLSAQMKKMKAQDAPVSATTVVDATTV
ncbi:unnamed protein product [Mucor hiemalis]